MTRLLFVVPELGGHPSGGTRYNAAILRELRTRGVAFDVCEPVGLELAIDAGARWVWIDSLYLSEFEALLGRIRRASGARVGLLLHYLPALLRVENDAAVELGTDEACALSESDALLVTGEFMRQRAIELGYPASRCRVVEPGCELERQSRAGLEQPGLCALVVAHVVPGKGILEFLEALALRLSPSDPLTLSIAGDLHVDAAYSERCQALVRTSPSLAGRVAFLGVISEPRLVRELHRHQLLVSASRMESYGMALAEARTLGIPIAARRGGNVQAHVAPEWGGALVQGFDELAACCIRLARDPAELEARARLAHRNARAPRPWALVAEQFSLALSGFESLSLRHQPEE